MTARASWHSPVEVDHSDDPFAEPQRIEDVGVPIVLDAADGEAKLHRQLARSLTAEGELEARGVTCAVKNARDTSCHACPLYRADDSLEAALCAVGRLQERLCTEIAVSQHGGRR